MRRPGTLCDPGDACNAHLMCTDTDPRMQPGGCPISKRSFKDDIHYLSPAAVGERYQALLGVKLAEYRYKTEAPGGTPHLGFIIDDGVPAEALRASHDQVDLYGYTTLTVAAIQSQAREIEALKAEVAELRALLKAKGVGGQRQSASYGVAPARHVGRLRCGRAPASPGTVTDDPWLTGGGGP